ncbi:MAG: septal ring lytic transglycosylase RlpA family protein [Pseudomonadota bacterium]
MKLAPTVLHRIALAALLLVAGCSTGPKILEPRDGAPRHRRFNIAAIPDAVPRWEPRTSAGNPPFYEVFGKRYHVLPDSKGYVKKGIASWYGTKFHGKHTSNGEDYDMFSMTAAHKTLPIPCYARVTNLENGRSIVVRINDRGPFHGNRIIDLSYVAAVKLGIYEAGTGFVEVRTVEPDSRRLRSDRRDKASDIYLQIGAFSNWNNARKLQHTVASHDLPGPRIRSNGLGSRQIHRVQIGPIASVDEADRISRTLSNLGITETRFVTEQAGAPSRMVQ